MKNFKKLLLWIFIPLSTLVALDGQAQAPVCPHVAPTGQANQLVAGGITPRNVAQVIQSQFAFEQYKHCETAKKIDAALQDMQSANQKGVAVGGQEMKLDTQISGLKLKLKNTLDAPNIWVRSVNTACSGVVGAAAAPTPEQLAACARCLQPSMQELAGMVPSLGWSPAEIGNINADIGTLQAAINAGPKSSSTASACPVPEQSIVLTNDEKNTVAGNATTPQQKKELEEDAEKSGLGLINSTSPWMATLHLGYSLMPEYDDNGDNQGFTEGNVFGRFAVDGRKEMPPKAFFGAGGFIDYYALHTGASMDLFSAHVVDCQKLDQTKQDPMQDPMQNQDSEEEAGDDEAMDANGMEMDGNDDNCGKEPGDLDFNDIAQSMNASAYVWLHAHSSDWFNPGTEVGVGFRASAQTREKLGDNNDSIDKIYSVGARLVYNEYMTVLKEGKRLYQNGMPKFILEVNFADYDEYAGIDDYDKVRRVVHMAYRVTDKSPTYLGAYINDGEGPDEIAVTISYGFDLEKWVEAAF